MLSDESSYLVFFHLKHMATAATYFLVNYFPHTVFCNESVPIKKQLNEAYAICNVVIVNMKQSFTTGS